ncbi:hypothetical protein, partial [Klebsiella pneumoniae]|uniref:hypothetical protein n=1 Tax=Klebsiella pneumoniae TaxID=573 RepID=UPI0039C38B2E
MASCTAWPARRGGSARRGTCGYHSEKHRERLDGRVATRHGPMRTPALLLTLLTLITLLGLPTPARAAEP